MKRLVDTESLNAECGVRSSESKRLVDTETAARVLGTSKRTIERWFMAGKIEGQFCAGGKGGGKGGQVLKVWIDDSAAATESTDGSTQQQVEVACSDRRRDRHKVRGEAGSSIVTEFKGGEPIINIGAYSKPTGNGGGDLISAGQSAVPGNRESPQAILPNPPSPPTPCEVPTPAPQGTLFPAIQERPNQARLPSEKCNRISNLRFAFIQAFNEDLKDNHRPKTEIVNRFLGRYNDGLILSHIKKELKTVKRATLYNWLQLYDQGGIEGLIPQYQGPPTSGIAPAEKDFLLRKLLDQNKPTIGDTINKCKFLLGEVSSSSPTKLRCWINDFRKNNYDLWVLEREGQKALNDKCVPYAEREWRDLQVGEAVVADGHKLNFQVISPFSGKPCRAVMVLFWDWKSAYPLGWEIMLTENIQCVVAALRNAVITLGKFPTHALLDNGKAFRAAIFTKKFRFEETEIPGIFDRLNITPHFAMPYNAQSKPIERFFRTFNDWFERDRESYTGSSIPDKPAHLSRNEKRAQELHSDNDWVPTIPETMQLVFRWREYYAGQELRARDGQRPGDIFKSEKGPGVDPFALHFLMMACKARMVHRNGITFNGWHWYHEDLYGLKDYVLMFYSYYDLSQVYIFRMQQNGSPGKFLCTAKPIEKTKVFASDEFPEDVAAVQRVNSMKRKAINTTKRLADMLQSQKQVYIDWNRTLRDRPEVADAIKQIEDKAPKVVKISPFADEEQSQPSAPNEEPVRYSALSAPAFDHEFEYYDWYTARDPKSLNDADRAWIADYMKTDQWEKFYGKKQATGGEG